MNKYMIIIITIIQWYLYNTIWVAEVPLYRADNNG